MIFDIAWKVARKSLNPALYDFLSYRVFGRNRNYEKLGTYQAIFGHYCAAGLSFRDATVVEAGCGLQLMTALHMLQAGARKVILVEPKLRLDRNMIGRSLAAFNSTYGTGFSEGDILPRLESYPDLSDIPEDWSGCVDLLCSYTVLEHVREPAGFFRSSRRLLKEGGRAYHLVDLSDHTYQFFARFPVLRDIAHRRILYHLRYSNRVFRHLNDPKCYMNRVLIPEYLKLARETGFALRSLKTEPYSIAARIHPDLLRGLPQVEAGELQVSTFGMELEKPPVGAG